MLLLLTLACGPEPLVENAEPFKSGGSDNLLRGEQEMFTYARSVVINTPGESPRLFILEGVKTERGYHASKLGVGEIYSGLFDSWWTLVEECTGEMVEVDGVVTFTTGGNATCEAFAGEWELEKKKKSVAATIPKNTACGLYTHCVCDLSTAWTLSGQSASNPFSDSCFEARQLLSTAADDPGTCAGGRVIFSSLAGEMGMDVPESCTASP